MQVQLLFFPEIDKEGFRERQCFDFGLSSEPNVGDLAEIIVLLFESDDVSFAVVGNNIRLFQFIDVILNEDCACSNHHDFIRLREHNLALRNDIELHACHNLFQIILIESIEKRKQLHAFYQER